MWRRWMFVLLLGLTPAVQAQSLAEARELLEARRFIAAAAAATTLIDATTADTRVLAEAHALRGAALVQRSQPAAARADFQRAFELDATLTSAALGLGRAERHGWGAEPDPVRAQDLLQQAAAAGSAEAAQELAFLHLSRQPAAVDEGVAALQQAAGLGARDAAFTLGELYRAGQFVSADEAQALRWYRHAAELGHAAAQYRVGMAYLDGTGVAADPATAATWVQRATDQGYSEAVHFTAFNHEAQGDMVQANHHYLLAAQAGLMRAQINLGLSWLMGNRGLPQDFARAYYWFARARGAALADYHRARLLEYGRGVRADLPAAFAAYEAASRVLPEAKVQLALLLEQGKGVAADPAAAARLWAELARLDSPADLNSVAWALATHPDTGPSHAALALELAQRAAALAPEPAIHDTLAAAYAAAGDLPQAIRVQEQALQELVGATPRAEFEAHLASYRAGQRWVETLPDHELPVDMSAYPASSVVFTGEILGLRPGAPANAAVNLDLDPGHSEWGLYVRVGAVERGALPQHLQETVVLFLHSPTELFARLPVEASFLAPPEGEYRFILSLAALDYSLEMQSLTAP